MKAKNVSLMTLHVQASNEAALQFYQKHGFDQVEKLEGYYKDLDDADCYVLNKKIDLSELQTKEETKEEAGSGQGQSNSESKDDSQSTQLPSSGASAAAS